MDEKKSIKVSLGTVICIFIIILLVVVICGMYFYYNDKNKVAGNELSQANTASQEKIESNQEVINNATNSTTAQETESKNEYKISFEEEVYKSYKENGELTFENKRNLPVITNAANQTAANNIVTSLTGFSDKKWAEIKKASDEYKESTTGSGVQYLFNISLTNNNYIVFKATQSGDFGGVGWTAEEFYNYDAKTGSLLTLRNIATDYTNLKKVISDKVLNYIDTNINVNVQNVEQSVNDILAQDGNWGFTESGIIIKIPKYSIGDGATGIHTVQIDKSDINPYLLEAYKIK